MRPPDTTEMEAAFGGRLGEILISEGKLTEERLQEALEQQRTLKARGGESRGLGNVLVSMGFVSQADLARALARRLDLPFVDLREEIVDPGTVALVGEDLARKHCVVPLRVEDGRLLVAMCDPNHVFARADLAVETGYPLAVAVASTDDIVRTQEEIFAPEPEPPQEEEVAQEEALEEEEVPEELTEEPVAAESLTLYLRQGRHAREISIDPEVAGLVSEEVLREHTAIPVSLENGVLLMAVSDLGDMRALEALMTHSDYPLSFVEALKREIRQVQNSLWASPGSTAPEVVTAEASAEEPLEAPTEETLAREAPVEEERGVEPEEGARSLNGDRVADEGEVQTTGGAEKRPGVFGRLLGGRRGSSGRVPRPAAPLIVVADDDPDILGLIRRRLPKRGYEVVAATDGREALDAVREHLPAAVVIDWMMPEMQGPEVCAVLKADPETANIPVVLLTAKGAEYDIERAFQYGADEYITKPFDIVDVDETLKRLLEEKPPL